MNNGGQWRVVMISLSEGMVRDLVPCFRVATVNLE